MEKNELEFFKEWLALDKYSFKILTIVTVLADNQRAFRGKLSELCAELSIQPSGQNIANIKKSLSMLHQQGYIQLIEDKNIYTISLAQAAEKSKNIIKIKKAWYSLIKNYTSDTQNKASWESMLKVFLLLIELKSDSTYTYEQLGKELNLSKSTVGRCVNALKKINFQDFKFDIQVVKKKASDDVYYTLGTIYNQMIVFE